MGHTVREKQKLLNRVRRIKGRSKPSSEPWRRNMVALTFYNASQAVRGAMNGLLGLYLKTISAHHLVDAETTIPRTAVRPEQLVEVVHSYFK